VRSGSVVDPFQPPCRLHLIRSIFEDPQTTRLDPESRCAGASSCDSRYPARKKFHEMTQGTAGTNCQGLDLLAVVGRQPMALEGWQLAGEPFELQKLHIDEQVGAGVLPLDILGNQDLVTGSRGAQTSGHLHGGSK
jgi:hypothetical protein